MDDPPTFDISRGPRGRRGFVDVARARRSVLDQIQAGFVLVCEPVRFGIVSLWRYYIIVPAHCQINFSTGINSFGSFHRNGWFLRGRVFFTKKGRIILKQA